ncbi:MAG: PaaI family thioesterase [Acidimicrobiales bacterium]
MNTTQEASAVSVEECNKFIAELDFVDPVPVIEEVARDWVIARIPTNGLRLRPGGYVPGPVMMSAVDLVAWFLVFTRNGFTPMALTWELKINFLRPAHGADLMIRARQTKFGKLCHASIDLHMDGDPDRLVAHATTTYVLPADS